jgi:hypothetical protein
MLVRKASSESALGLLIKTVDLGEGIGIGTGSVMESITQTMLRGSGSMPIHKLGNDDTTEKEKEKERKEKKGNTKKKENVNQHENEDDEPDMYGASSFARLNRAARDTSLSSFAVGDTNGITLDTYTDLASNCNNSYAQELLRSQLHAVRLRLRLYLRL